MRSSRDPKIAITLLIKCYRPRAVPRLDRLDTAGLVAALDSPNGWQRDTAQQLLLWRKDQAAVPLLEKLAAEFEEKVQHEPA